MHPSPDILLSCVLPACMCFICLPSAWRLKECVGAPRVRQLWVLGTEPINFRKSKYCYPPSHLSSSSFLLCVIVYICAWTLCVYSWRPEKGVRYLLSPAFFLRQGLMGSSVCSSCLPSKCCDSLSHCSTLLYLYSSR